MFMEENSSAEMKSWPHKWSLHNEIEPSHHSSITFSELTFGGGLKDLLYSPD
jgi:hypothetical protein